ncbi:porin family protein, partial [Aquisalimonas sp.]|uniref:porin family protein n=1 Tax=Aquisalimonas sp. TaxID=1872621 RepID=UPI0025BAE363
MIKGITMRHCSTALPLFLALTLATSNALATEAPRPYLAADAGLAFVDRDDTKSRLDDLESHAREMGAQTSKDIDGRSFAFSLGAGLRVTRYLSAELNYYNLGEFDAELTVSTDDETSQLNIEVDFSGFGTRVIGHLPVAQYLTLDASAGVGRITTERNIDSLDGTSGREKSTDTVYNLGIGAQYHIHRHWAIRGQLTRFFNVGDGSIRRDQVDVATLGGVY